MIEVVRRANFEVAEDDRVKAVKTVKITIGATPDQHLEAHASLEQSVLEKLVIAGGQLLLSSEYRKGA